MKSKARCLYPCIYDPEWRQCPSLWVGAKTLGNHDYPIVLDYAHIHCILSTFTYHAFDRHRMGKVTRSGYVHNFQELKRCDSTCRHRTFTRMLADEDLLRAAVPRNVRWLGPLGVMLTRNAITRVSAKYPTPYSAEAVDAAFDRIRAAIQSSSTDYILGDFSYAGVARVNPTSRASGHASLPLFSNEQAHKCTHYQPVVLGVRPEHKP